MRALKRISDLLIYSNIFISVAAALLIYETYGLLALKANLLYPALGFFSTLFIYNIDRLIVLKNMRPEDSERHKWIIEHSNFLKLITAISLIFLCIIVFFLPFSVIAFLFVLGLISTAYSVPLLFKGKTLRNIKGLKIFLITFVWASTTVIMPALAQGYSIFQKEVVLFFAERALFIFILTLPFDIRDYQSDIKDGVLTIPGAIGIPNTRKLILVCAAIFMLINLIHYPISNPVFWGKLISISLSAWLAQNAKEDSHEYYFTGLIDGMMILQFLVLWIV